MAIQRIFWLDDNFAFLGRFLHISKSYGLTKESLFAKVTFAYDQEMGESIIKNKDFDLYILDGDFPRITSEKYREKLNVFLNGITSENKHYAVCDELNKLSNETKGPFVNRFAEFYLNNLRDKTGKVIVHSLSSFAPHIAFHLGLPFYGKVIDADDIKIIVNKLIDDPSIDYFIGSVYKKNVSFLEGWEIGSCEDLIKRYLTC